MLLVAPSHCAALKSYLKQTEQNPGLKQVYFYAHFRDEETEVKVV